MFRSVPGFKRGSYKMSMRRSQKAAQWLQDQSLETTWLGSLICALPNLLPDSYDSMPYAFDTGDLGVRRHIFEDEKSIYSIFLGGILDL